MTNTERVKNYRERQAKQGRRKRELYLNDEEFEAVKKQVSKLRNK